MNQDLAVFITPAALAISCALTAFAGGVLILGLLEIILAGSSVYFFKAQQVRTSLCELDGESAHPEARRGADEAIIQKAIIACMKGAGYEWADRRHACKTTRVATNPYCYLPADWFDRAITVVQLSFE